MCTYRSKHYPTCPDSKKVECGRCGNFIVTGSVLRVLVGEGWESSLDETEKAAVGFWLKTQQAGGHFPELTSVKLQELRDKLYFPDVETQLELLLIDMGDFAKSIGKKVTVREIEDQYCCGARS